MNEKPSPLTVRQALDIIKEQYPKDVSPPAGALDALIEAQTNEAKSSDTQEE